MPGYTCLIEASPTLLRQMAYKYSYMDCLIKDVEMIGQKLHFSDSRVKLSRRQIFANLQKSFAVAAFACAVTLAAGAVATQPAWADAGLTYDGDHDVVVLPGCDFALRFNNKTFVPVRAEIMDDKYVGFMKIAPEKAIRIFEDYGSANMKSTPEQIVVESYDVGKIGAFGMSRFHKDFVANNRVREVQFTNARVAKETGLSDNAFLGINSAKSYEVAPKSGETPYYLYVLLSGSHMNCYARKMRGTSGTFDNDPAVIITQVRVGNTKDCLSNVPWPGADTKPAADGATDANKPSTN